MTLAHAQQLRRTVQALTREIGALELDALSKGWTAATGILVVTLAHRRLDYLEQIEEFLMEQERETEALRARQETTKQMVAAWRRKAGTR